MPKIRCITADFIVFELLLGLSLSAVLGGLATLMLGHIGGIDVSDRAVYTVGANVDGAVEDVGIVAVNAGIAAIRLVGIVTGSIGITGLIRIEKMTGSHSKYKGEYECTRKEQHQ